MKIDRSRLLLLLFLINSIHRKRLFSAAPSDPESMNGASAKDHTFNAKLNLTWGFAPKVESQNMPRDIS